ncbi:unnamed protein product [Arctogadus glacialis]
MSRTPPDGDHHRAPGKERQPSDNLDSAGHGGRAEHLRMKGRGMAGRMWIEGPHPRSPTRGERPFKIESPLQQVVRVQTTAREG